MKKTVDLTNVTRLRSKLRLQLDAMKVDEAAVTMQELEVVAKEACMEITGLEYIATPTTWDDFLKILEKNNQDGFSSRGSDFEVPIEPARPGSTEERFNLMMTQHYTEKGQLGPDIDPITPFDEFPARYVQWVAGQPMVRGAMINQLEAWRLEAVELGLGLCALKLMEAKEDLVNLGEPELPEACNNIVRDCLMRMAEKKGQNVMASRYGTRSVIRGGNEGRNVQTIGRLHKPAVNPVIVNYTGRKRHPFDTIIDPEAPEFNAEQHIIELTRNLERSALAGQLVMWQTQCVSLKLVAQAGIFAKEVETLGSLSDADYDALEEKVSPSVLSAVIYLSEVHSRNAEAVTLKPMRNIGETEVPFEGMGLKGIIQMEIPEGEMPMDIYGKSPDILMPKQVIKSERPDFGILPMTPSVLLREGCKNEKYHDKPLMEMGSYLQPTKPEGYHIKVENNQTAVNNLNAQKLRTRTFTSIVPQELAQRMINDIQHLINITNDADYAEALSNEVRRLQLFANGDVKSLSDVNFAWVYHE